MDAVLFGAGLKRVLFGMVCFVGAFYFAVALIGHAQGKVSSDTLALVGAAFGAVSIGGITAMLVREIRRSVAASEVD